MIVHVLLHIVESNALFFKSTGIWISKWGAGPVKHKHSFILSSWIGERVERWWQFIESVTVYVRPFITSLSALSETFPLSDSTVRACRNTGKSILRFCSISSGKSSAMNKFDPFKFPFFEQMLSRSLIENLAIIGLFWPLTYFPFRWHFNICIFLNSGSIFRKFWKLVSHSTCQFHSVVHLHRRTINSLVLNRLPTIWFCFLTADFQV